MVTRIWRRGISGAADRGSELFQKGTVQRNGTFNQVDLPRYEGPDILHGLLITGAADPMGNLILSGKPADLPIAPGTDYDKHDYTSFLPGRWSIVTAYRGD
jgi:hypothetical protein